MDLALDLAASTLRLATPLIFAVLGGLLSERAGVIALALEGQMIVGAFAAAVLTQATGQPWLGFGAGGVAGLALAALYGAAALPGRANQIVAATGINMLALGIPPFLTKILYDVTSSTPALALDQRLQWEPLVLAPLGAVLVALGLGWTRGGLWLQVAGEHPEALAASGVNVQRVRWAAVLASGFWAGLGGASLAIFLSSAYTRHMTAGRGFIALAALILGKWRPGAAVVACLFFGLADAVQIRLQGVSLPGVGPVPVQFIQILPYLVTLVVLAGFVGRAEGPRALGGRQQEG